MNVKQRKNELYINQTYKRMQKDGYSRISYFIIHNFIAYSLNKNIDIFNKNTVEDILILMNINSSYIPKESNNFSIFIESIISILSIKYGPGTAGIRIHCWDDWKHSKNWYNYYVNNFFVKYYITWKDFNDAVIKSYIINYL